MDPYSDNSIATNWTASTNTIVSVRDAENSIKLKLYPTPVKDYLTIESSGTIKIVELFDFQGRLIRRADINSGYYRLDMSSNPRGIYLIQIITPSGNFVQKIIKE